MRARNTLFAAAALATLGACSKTADGDVVINKPTGITTSPDTLHRPTVGMKAETISTPVVGTRPETVIVNKPVVGMKKTEVKVPVIKRHP